MLFVMTTKKSLTESAALEASTRSGRTSQFAKHVNEGAPFPIRCRPETLYRPLLEPIVRTCSKRSIPNSILLDSVVLLAIPADGAAEYGLLAAWTGLTDTVVAPTPDRLARPYGRPAAMVLQSGRNGGRSTRVAADKKNPLEQVIGNSPGLH